MEIGHRADAATETTSRGCLKIDFHTGGKIGHLARDCRSAGAKTDKTCRICGKVGHLARDCRSKGAQKGGKGTKRGRGGPRSASDLDRERVPVWNHGIERCSTPSSRRRVDGVEVMIDPWRRRRSDNLILHRMDNYHGKPAKKGKPTADELDAEMVVCCVEINPDAVPGTTSRRWRGATVIHAGPRPRQR